MPAKRPAALAVFVVWAAAAGIAAGQTRAPSSPYSKLDNVKLAQTLGRMGMTAVLEGLKAELDRSGDELSRVAVGAQLHVAKASQLAGQGKTAERDRELDAAVAMLRRAIEKEPPESADTNIWAGFFRVRFMLASVLALEKGQSYAMAVLFLLADEKDRLALEEVTGEAVYHLDGLADVIDRKLRGWKGNIDDVLMKVPAIEQLQNEMRLDSARIYLYRGISLPDPSVVEEARKKVDQAALVQGDKRVELLRQVLKLLGESQQSSQKKTFDDVERAGETINEILSAAPGMDAKDLDRLFRRASGSISGISRRKRRVLEQSMRLLEPYAAGGAAAEVKYWALLWQGIAAREAGQHEQAAVHLNKIRQASATPEGSAVISASMLIEALFQLARSRVEGGQPDAAASLTAIQEYRDTCLKLTPPAQHGTVEICTCLLKSYLYDRLAAAAKAANDAEKATLYQLDVAGSVFAFEDEYEQVARKMAELAAGSKEVGDLQRRLRMLSDLQAALFGYMARKYENSLLQEGVEPLLKDAIRVAIIVRDVSAARSEQSKRDVLKTLDKILKTPLPSGRSEAVLAKASRIRRRIQTTAHLYAGDTLYRLHESAKNDAERWMLMQEASEHWFTIASDYPDHPMAFTAAEDAAKALKNLGIAKTAAGETLTDDFYRRYRQALTTLLGRWGDRPGVEEWHQELAWIRVRDAGDKFNPEALQDIIAAIDSFEKATKESKRYMEDHFAALSKRMDLLIKKQRWLESLEKCKDRQQREQLTRALAAYTDEGYMVGVLARYADQAALLLPKTSEKEYRQMLLDSGSWAALRSAEMLREKGVRETNPQLQAEAISQVQKIQTMWKGTAPATEAEVYEILWRFERGDTEAVDKLQNVLKERPAEAERLLPAIYAIRNTSREMVKSKVRGKYVERYERFAKIIYEQTGARPDRDQRRFDAVAKYADALLEAGKAADAMTFWQLAQKLDDLRMQEQKAKIDAEVDAWTNKVNSASGSIRILKDVASECIIASKAKGVYGRAAAQLERYLDSADNADALAKMVTTACSTYRQVAKDAVPADADVIEGLARGCMQTGKFAEAMPFYQKLLQGLTEEDAAFWNLQLEYAECWLKAHKGDKEAIKRLVAYVRQIRAENRPGFGEILSEAGRYSQ